MDYYLDIQKAPKAKMADNRWLNAVYSKLHIRLYDLQADNIGVSFPQYKILLGTTLRLHSTKEHLQKLMQDDWLIDSKPDCNIANIKAVPKQVKYQTVSRKCILMSEAKLRRLIKRGTISEADIKKYRIAMCQKTISTDLKTPYNPYIELTSASNGIA